MRQLVHSLRKHPYLCLPPVEKWNDLWFFDEWVISYCDIYEGQCYQGREVLDCELSLISARDKNATKYIHMYSTRFCGCNPSRTLCPRDKRNNHGSALTAVITMEGHKSIRRTYLMTTYRSMLYNHYIVIGGKQFWVHNNSTLLQYIAGIFPATGHPFIG